MSFKENILEVLKRYEQQKLELEELTKKDLTASIVAIMNTSPYIESISWTQYTPYFNDGDPCYFNVYNDDLEVNEISPDENEDAIEDENNLISMKIVAPKITYGMLNTEEEVKFSHEQALEMGSTHMTGRPIGAYGYKKNPLYDPILSKPYEEIKELMDLVPSQFYESLYGDHVKVTIKRDGTVDVQEYEHN